MASPFIIYLVIFGLLAYTFIVKFYNASWSLLKSTDLNINYDYLSGAKMIFKDLLKNDSIRNF